MNTYCKYDCLEDPYIYPGTRVLRNEVGVRRQELLSDIKHQITELARFTIGQVNYVNKDSLNLSFVMYR